MTPEQALKKTEEYLKNLEKLKRSTLKVGFPVSVASSTVYKSGVSLLEVAVAHEFGTLVMPARSMVRVPIELHKEELNSDIDKICYFVFEKGKDPIPGLKVVGVKATNIMKKAFDTNGYGTWEALNEQTIALKLKAGKTTPLIWSGTLKKHITWIIE